MGKLRRSTVYNSINKYCKFIVATDSYSSRNEEKIYTLQELEAVISENIAIWEAFESKYGGIDFKNSWKELEQQINTGIEEARECSSSDKVKQANMFLRTLNLPQISTYNTPKLEEKIIKVRSPILGDKDFNRIYTFIVHAYEKLISMEQLEYVYESVIHYIQLINDPGEITRKWSSGYISESIPAFYCLREEILGNKTDWDRISQDTLERYNSVLEAKLTSYKEKINHVYDSLEEIADNVKTQKEEAIANIQKYEQELKALEDTYREKLKLEAPEQLWKDNAKNYEKKANLFMYLAIVTGVFLVLSLGILAPRIITAQDQGHWFSPTIILIALVSFILYLIRIFIKHSQAHRHLQISCQERQALTRFYQALVFEESKDGNEKTNITTDERLLIFKTLFTTTDSGLVKTNDSGSDLETLLSIIKRN